MRNDLLFQRITLSLTFLIGSPFVISDRASGEEILLEDYEGGGLYQPANWANTAADSNGNQNQSLVKDDRAVVDWATQWSGLPSSGQAKDLSRFKTFQVDVMVEKGQPVEPETNFYFQLTNETPTGYSYWETFVPQSKIPADGQWYRVTFPINKMDKGYGDGGDAPEDFKAVNGTCCGMTFDEPDNKFKFKRAMFDNVMLNDKEVTEAQVTPLK